MATDVWKNLRPMHAKELDAFTIPNTVKITYFQTNIPKPK